MYDPEGYSASSVHNILQDTGKNTFEKLPNMLYLFPHVLRKFESHFVVFCLNCTKLYWIYQAKYTPNGFVWKFIPYNPTYQKFRMISKIYSILTSRHLWFPVGTQTIIHDLTNIGAILRCKPNILFKSCFVVLLPMHIIGESPIIFPYV